SGRLTRASLARPGARSCARSAARRSDHAWARLRPWAESSSAPRMSAFASPKPLTGEQLAAAPIRYPRPSRLARPLRVAGEKASRAAAALGLQTVGDLFEHLPRDRREA